MTRLKQLKIWWLIIFLSLLTEGSLIAVSLEECIKWARENYPEVKRFNIIEATAQCNLKNAKYSRLPLISLGAQGGWLNKTTDIRDIINNVHNPGDLLIFDEIVARLGVESIPQWQYGVSVDVIQPIYDGGAAKVRQKLARGRSDVERAEVDVSLKKLEETVQDVYFSLLLLEKRREQMGLQEEVIERNVQTLHALVEEGTVCDIDVKALEVASLKLHQQIEVLNENVESYRTTLSLLTGHDVRESELSIPQRPEESPTAFSNLPESKLLDSKLALIRLQKEYDRLSLMPGLAFVSHLNYGHPSSNLFDDLTNQYPKFNVALGLKLSWNIHSFYNHRNNLKLMRLNEESLDIQRELLFFHHNISNVSVIQQLRHMDDICSQDEKIIDICGDLRKAEEVKVGNGAGDANSLIDKINDEADARLTGIIHEIEYIQNLYKLNHNGQ